MKYTMKAGRLSTSQEEIQAYIKRCLPALDRRICDSDGKTVFKTHIRTLCDPKRDWGDVRLREYVLLDAQGTEHVTARPGYSEGEAPEMSGWPLNRMPRVDHAIVRMGEDCYYLVMRNVQSYYMEDRGRRRNVLQVSHRSCLGGWNIESEESLFPAVICGIFIFCRYLEMENEFAIV